MAFLGRYTCGSQWRHDANISRMPYLALGFIPTVKLLLDPLVQQAVLLL